MPAAGIAMEDADMEAPGSPPEADATVEGMDTEHNQSLPAIAETLVGEGSTGSLDAASRAPSEPVDESGMAGIQADAEFTRAPRAARAAAKRKRDSCVDRRSDGVKKKRTATASSSKDPDDLYRVRMTRSKDGWHYNVIRLPGGPPRRPWNELAAWDAPTGFAPIRVGGMYHVNTADPAGGEDLKLPAEVLEFRDSRDGHPHMLIVAWLYTKSILREAGAADLKSWPEKTEYMRGNHLDIIDVRSVVHPASDGALAPILACDENFAVDAKHKMGLRIVAASDRSVQLISETRRDYVEGQDDE